MLDFEPINHEGISQASIDRFLKIIRKYGLNEHSILIARDGRLCFERYWAPFTKDTPHRMYSVAKSFVSIAVGCLAAEGKLSLDDPIIKFFPDKLPDPVPSELQQQTVRDMLKMSTCFAGINWFKEGVTDRTAFYFSNTPVRPAGTLFDYDSTGSYILGVMVERVSGQPLLTYLREKVLDEVGGFENAEILETPDGTPWGDSALVCTPRALAAFAQCLMDGGRWNGRQILDPEYVRLATTSQTDNNLTGVYEYNHHGYGYQFWMTEHGGFSFHGMGGQFAVCIPDKNFLFVCTGDNQIDPHANVLLFRALFETLIDPLYDTLPEVDDRQGLPVGRGQATAPMAEKINGVWFRCDPNPMGITRFQLTFHAQGGLLRYVNAQGDKELPFGLGRNEFTFFPELGYSDGRGNVHELTGFKYRCAVSGGWVDEHKLQIFVQVIDRYFGELCMTFGFRDENTVGVRMTKAAEDFFQTYNGWMGARREQ